MWSRLTRAQVPVRSTTDEKKKSNYPENKCVKMTTKKPSPTKTRTGNALAQFMILCGLTVVAYQFLASRVYPDETTSSASSSPNGGGGTPSPSPWTDAALEKHRAEREAVSTTEFSCFMACVGLFGLMQRKKNSQEEEALLEAKRRSLEATIKHKKRSTKPMLARSVSSSSSNSSCDQPSPAPLSPTALVPTRTSVQTDLVKALPVELQLELLAFVAPQDLVTCAIVCRAWYVTTGDRADDLWRRVFARDFRESGDRFNSVLPRLCWRQYYFQHHLSRAVEIARLLDMTQGRKCIVVEGIVYDVTNFLDLHPGGFHVIGDVIGTDASVLWEQFHHSREAKELMKEFVVDDAILSAKKRKANSVIDLNGNLAVVQQRWEQMSWCLAHAHLVGGLSMAFLDVSFRFIKWKTERSATRILSRADRSSECGRI